MKEYRFKVFSNFSAKGDQNYRKKSTVDTYYYYNNNFTTEVNNVCQTTSNMHNFHKLLV